MGVLKLFILSLIFISCSSVSEAQFIGTPEPFVGSAVEDMSISRSESIANKSVSQGDYIIKTAYASVDVSAHVFGVNSEEWIKEIKIFEELVKKITELSNKRSYTVISADHGLTNVPKENRFHITYNEDVNIYGDQRSVYINGSKKDIIEIFSKVPGQLIDRSELNYLLPITENDFIESLYPDFCFLVEDKNIIYPHHLKTELAGYHGGLSTEEIKIPIIEISNF